MQRQTQIFYPKGSLVYGMRHNHIYICMYVCVCVLIKTIYRAQRWIGVYFKLLNKKETHWLKHTTQGNAQQYLGIID